MKILRHPLTLMAIIAVAYLIAPFGTPPIAALAKDFLPAMATLVAAWIGVSHGASLTRNAAYEDEKRRQIGAGARAMFTLWRQVNVVAQIQEDILDDYKDKKEAAIISLPPIDYPLDDIPRLDLDSLAFFLDLGDALVLETLVIAEQNFLHAVDVVKTRSTLHLKEVQPILEKIIPNGGSVSHTQLELALGPRLFSQLIDQTKRLTFRVEHSIIDLDNAAMTLYTALKKAFPDAKFPMPSKPTTE